MITNNIKHLEGISSDYARKMPQGKYKAEYKAEHRNQKKSAKAKAINKIK